MKTDYTKLVTHIPNSDVISIPSLPQNPLIRAAYCRVSTDDPAQEYSIEGQTAHWTAYIADQQSHPDSTPWEFAGIYSESGLSGTKAETRPQLMQLI